jgi:hypothetical protein
MNDSAVKQVPTITTPVAKRRRSDSPTNHQQLSEIPTLSYDQLKLQYGNMTVNRLVFILFLDLFFFILG